MANRLSELARAVWDWVASKGLHKEMVFGACMATVIGGVLLLSPPVRTIGEGEAGIRVDRLSGHRLLFGPGSVWVWPGFQELQTYSLRDVVFHPTAGAKANGTAPFQSVEGLSLGVDLSVRYALDPSRLLPKGSKLPANIGADVVEPEVNGVAYRVLAHYTVREIFSTKRVEIQQIIETELRNHLAEDGLLLRNVQVGNIDLPPDYRNGMQEMLTEELQAEKMRYTLELKEKEVKQRELEGEAEKVQREKSAEAAGQEQIIAARAQEEAMKHVLPFKQKQIEQRQLEAEADKVSRIKGAEASAQARVIEAGGEADSRRKLADAEVYRMEQVGKASSEQMARDGQLVSQHPLLIQKALADKLSDKVSVIIAPPGVAGGFIGAGLVGNAGVQNTGSAAQEQ